jgi:hypothetical protein
MALSEKEIEQNLGNAELANKLIMANGGSITIDGKEFTSGTEAFNYVKTKDISKLVVETTTTPTQQPAGQPGGQPAQIISKSGQGSMEEIYGYIAGAFDIGELTSDATTLLAIVFAESGGFEQVQSGNLATNQNISNRTGMAEPSFGLFQINADVWLHMIRKEDGGEIKWSNPTQLDKAISNKNFYDLAIADQEAVAKWLSNPKNNSKIAKLVYDTQGFNAWSVYKNNDYMDFLREAATVTGRYYRGTDEITDDVTREGMSEFEQLLEGMEWGDSTPADATSYDVDKLNAELGITNTALGSSIKRGIERALRGNMGDKEWRSLVEDIGNAWTTFEAPDASTAERAGTLLRIAAIGAGVFARGWGSLAEETYGGLFNAATDLIRPEAGGAADAFWDALNGVEQGTNSYSTWWKENKPGWRYDAYRNNWYRIDNRDTTLTTEELLDEDPKDPPPPTTKTYWGRYDTGSWGTFPLDQKPADFKWAWELPEFEGQDQELFTGDKDLENDIYPLTVDYLPPPGTSSNFDTDGTNIVNIINEDGVPSRSALLSLGGNYFRTAGSSGEYKELTDAGYVDIPYTDPLFLEFIEQEGLDWTPTIEVEVVDDEVVDDEVVDDEVTTADTFEDTLELGTGYVANEVLNDWNNIPQGGILIDAGGQKFLGYQVPGAGQIYSEPPMYMLYQILDNDVYEAGLLTEGTPANVNVVLTSVADLNQYGLVVGGTDEITDDVEHPFIRFVENFEAGKKINPWLGDTRINPNSGVTYQQEAIEFLAEQAIEQWTPEETTVRVEASDWYQESTATQKQWLTKQLTQPVTAQQELDDKKIDIRTQMESLGMASPPDGLVDYFAEKSVTGMWSELYTTEQLALLADPYKPGARDTNLINFIEGVGFGSLDRASVMEKEVQDLYRTYLGPSLGNASATEISEKAGQLRNNPDAGGELRSYLEQQRLAMFPNYTNPTLRYNDIVQPYKNLVNQVWGEEADETSDWFIQMVQNNNIESAYNTLREKGMELGVERVQNQALQDLEDAIGEGSVQTDVGVNT